MQTWPLNTSQCRQTDTPGETPPAEQVTPFSSTMGALIRVTSSVSDNQFTIQYTKHTRESIHSWLPEMPLTQNVFTPTESMNTLLSTMCWLVNVIITGFK